MIKSHSQKSALIHCPVPWKGAVKRAKILEKALKDIGFKTDYIMCNGHRNHCYQKKLNGNSQAQCAKCFISNCYLKPSHLLNKKNKTFSNSPFNMDHWSATASIGSAKRLEMDSQLLEASFEDEKRLTMQDFANLKHKFRTILLSTKPNLCAIFNGRFHDSTALIEVCNELKIPFFTFELPWFGSGIQIISGADCISINGFRNSLYGKCSKTETTKNLKRAESFVSGRLNGKPQNEWRHYNQKLTNISNASVSREDIVLIIPSSRSEFIGHPEYELDFASSLGNLEYFLKKIRSNLSRTVLRSHPAWVQKIGNQNISKSLKEYISFCQRLDIEFIPPDSPVSTYDLMLRARIGIFNGSSAICEATRLGLPSVNLGPHRFSAGDFFQTLKGKAEMINFDLEEYTSTYDKKLNIHKMETMIARYLENAVYFNETSPLTIPYRPNNVTAAEIKRFENLVSRILSI